VIPELYLEFPAAAGEPPNQLKGFARRSLQAGERRRVRIPVDAQSFAIWSTADAAWRVLPGSYALRVGTSSRDLPLQGRVTMRSVNGNRTACRVR
jgi:beta-glucosidase